MPMALTVLLPLLTLLVSTTARPQPQAEATATYLATASGSILPSGAAPTNTAAPSGTGQPTRDGTVNQFQIVGNSGVSAQQMFLGTLNKVYILDKTEENLQLQVDGFPAWGSEYDLATDTVRGMFVLSNTFCAAGASLGNGSWVNFGGNQAVTWGGLTAASQTGGGPYDDWDGGQAVRLLDPCDDGTCEWVNLAPMTTRRWYPSVEPLEDGSVIVLGGDEWGGYVNDASQNNPTIEFFPSRGAPIGLNILLNSLPANLYPLTWLLPSGNLLIQTNWAAEIYDYKANVEYPLPNIPNAVRTYPGSGATAMLPLTPANNWTATVLFCGGTNLEPDQWVTNWTIAAYPADESCVSISPDISSTWTYDSTLPEGRTMGQFIMLPDSTLFLTNGGGTGTAGYGNDTWAIGHSYADNPVLTPLVYDPRLPAGNRWSRQGLGSSTVPRMYHSSALLLPDGSVFVAGSNPNPDYTVGAGVKYPTEYRTERFYPWYYSSRRPEPQGLPSNLSYGGEPFDVQLSAQDLQNNGIVNASVIVIRGGFSTHAMNMGQRFVQLNSTYTGNTDGSGTLHVSQLPPNPAILPPGPAMVFVTVGGVPSLGAFVMVGSGMGTQQVLPAGALKASSMPLPAPNTTGSGGGNVAVSAAMGGGVELGVGLLVVGLGLVALML
ncbi:glyoxal oxidase [Dacryopinax primogenitus]|uniref:Glyoxal oxidase n=1 Tax=Dacryopinax primogenitus (strain DJM 731) TaxID=1858805 RepID=M5FTW3_DACPD|nr:glyoxal oxidase [Dacryopinax primogenitus]EJU01106.1 glyoxal oxidase [Dacryopinax primogenitus]